MRRLLTLLGLDGIFDAYSEASPTTIGRGITLRGEIRGEGSVSVLGQFEGDNRLFVIPVEDVVAVFRKGGGEDAD